MALDNFALQNTNPLEAYLQGAGGIQTLQNNQQIMDARVAAQQLAQQQAQAAQAAAQAKQQAQLTMYNETEPLKHAKLVAQYQTAYPDDYKAVTDASKTISDAQKTNLLGLSSKLANVSATGNYELGRQILDQQVASMEGNVPDDQLAAVKTFQKRWDVDPKGVVMGLSNAAYAVDPSTYEANIKAATETAGLKAKLPSELAQATATTAKTYSDIEFKRDENRIKVLEAKAKKPMEEMQRQKLQMEIDAKKQELADKKSEQTAAGEGSAATFDNTIQTINNVLTHPGLSASVGKNSLFPTVPGSDSANFQSLLKTLKSQQFLTGVKALKSSGGGGALSDAEGAKITDAVGNLDLSQSEDAFKANVNTILGIVNAAKARSAKQYAGPPLIFDPRKTSYGSFVGGK
jgi:hypothetical protein